MSIDPEYEKAYSPSAWNNRFSREQVVVHFTQLAQTVTNRARSTVSCELDIPYGIGDRAKYDIYGNNLPNDAPIFIFLHGGYWQKLSKEFSGFPVEPLVSKGIKVITVGYNLCPAVTVTDIVAQVKSVTDKIVNHARDIGSKGVWIAGHSAGAHLAASFLHDDEWLASMKQKGRLQLIKGLILISGIYHLEPLTRTSYNNALKLSPDEVKNLSFGSVDTTQNQQINDIKVIIAAGEYDSPKFVQESKLYAQKLIDSLDDVKFMLLRNIDHFDIIENLADPNFELTKMIVNYVNHA